MTACIFNTFLIFTTYLNFIFHTSHGFEVIQPKSRTINPDGSVSISCEHTANVSSVEDVRLNAIPITGNPSLLCQKKQKDCKNITMHEENPKKWLFIILNIGPEAMNMKYECEFTVKKDDIDFTKTGAPTVLQRGQKEAPGIPHPTHPPPSQSQQLRWILIGLLALTLLYSCVITSFYIRLRVCLTATFTCSSRDPENSTYVEMRKAPATKYW